jgi:cytochrome c55X
MRMHASALGLLLLASTAWADMPSERQRQLINLLRHDCGSCHGMTLQGGLGPALTPQALAGKPAPYLRSVILDGRAGTPMPPWRAFISDDDATWLVDALKQGDIDAK